MTLVAMACLVLALELAVVGWSESSLRRFCRPAQSELFDLLMFAINAAGLIILAVFICSLGLSSAFAAAGLWITQHGPHIRTGSGALDFAIYFLLLDFLFYWVHRLFHTRALWWIHHTHHSAAVLNPLTAFRSNPANGMFDSLWRVIPAALLAGPTSTGATLAMVFQVHQLFIHSALPWNLGWLGRWIVCSPAGHRIHHSFDPAHYNRNFGGQLIIWDRLFGTWLFASSSSRRSSG